MNRLSVSVALLALGLGGFSGCAASPHSRAGGAVAPLQVRAIDYSPGHAPLEGVRAVADSGADVVAFADGSATVLSSGRVVAVDRSAPRWISAGTIPAADGSGTWIVGVDGDGRVRRLLGKSTLEPVSDRFGLGGDPVAGVAALGGAVTAFRLAGAVAVADGAAVTRYATGPITAIAAGGGRIVIGGERLRVFDVTRRKVSSFVLPEAASSLSFAVAASGKVFVATAETIWAEDDRGNLQVVFDAAGATLHGLAAAGDRVWFADGPELGVIEGGRVRETKGARVSPAAQITGSPSGDVWTLTSGSLARYAVTGDRAAEWDQAVAPVFHRACEGCHRPGGESGVPLGTREAWEKRRETVRRRVLVDRDMPPPGHGLSDGDRRSLQAWIEATR
jgi:hypothetical protein